MYQRCFQVWKSGSEKGFFWKRGLFRKLHFLEILENLEILEILENPQTSGKQRRIRPFSRDSWESRGFRDSRDSRSEKTPFSGPEKTNCLNRPKEGCVCTKESCLQEKRRKNIYIKETAGDLFAQRWCRDSVTAGFLSRAGAETPLNFREQFRVFPRTILENFSGVDTQTAVLVSTAGVWISAPDTQTPIFLGFLGIHSWLWFFCRETESFGFFSWGACHENQGLSTSSV